MMKRFRVLRRLIQIQRVFVRHGLNEYLRGTRLHGPMRVWSALSPWSWFAHSGATGRGARLRLALQDLGPIFVKFGQALSTRRDLLPADIADELAKLQDQVPAFPSPLAIQAIEAALGGSIAVLFQSFEDAPLAAASIAQVHGARLKDGSEVVVKVLRPGMHAVIRRDIEVLYALAAIADRYWDEARRLRPTEIVREYEKTIFDELDLMREAANAAQLKRNFAGSPLLYVPHVYWDLCRVNVMVMERIHGIIISHMDELKERGTNFTKLAENGVRIFFTQVFRHNFFHADMHPGNIFVQVDDPENPRYAAVDFGIVGTLQERDKHYLAENFLAFFDRDYHRIAVLHVESGWVPKSTRVDELESAVRTVCEPIFNKPLAEISFAQVLLRLFETARRFDMQVQPQLILLQKTLFNIEGLGRQLYPQLDLWKTAQPVLRDWMSERVAPKNLLRNLRQQIPDLVQASRSLPQILQMVARENSAGRFPFQLELRELQAVREEIQRSNSLRDAALVALVFWIAGIAWLLTVGEYRWIGWLFIIGGIITAMVKGGSARNGRSSLFFL